jgi:hypothetical protein
MNFRYAIALDKGVFLPCRDVWLEEAWGELPVSYIQGDYDLNECDFLDVKVDKWEVSPEWRKRYRAHPEPMINIKIYKGRKLKKYLRSTGCPIPEVLAGKIFVTLELEGDGEAIDEMLMERLVSFFSGEARLYRRSRR